jgi:hypothetical protein
MVFFAAHPRESKERLCLKEYEERVHYLGVIIDSRIMCGWRCEHCGHFEEIENSDPLYEISQKLDKLLRHLGLHSDW